MEKIVFVVRGGTSHESEKSAQYGKKILSCLQELGLQSHDLYLHPNGIWTLDNSPINLEKLFADFQSRDQKILIWNCLVGVDGEMGIVEALSLKYNIKLLGHSFLSTKLASDKKNFLKFAKTHNFKTPYSHIIQKTNNLKQEILKAFGTVGIPAIVKPVNGSGLANINVVNNFTELEGAVLRLLEQGENVLVEKLIKGVPVSVFVLEHENLFHTNIHIYDNAAEIGKQDLINLRNEALYLHEVLSPGHHTEYDFIFSPKGSYLIEANTHPSLAHGYISDFFRDNIVSLRDYVEKKIG